MHSLHYAISDMYSMMKQYVGERRRPLIILEQSGNSGVQAIFNSFAFGVKVLTSSISSTLGLRALRAFLDEFPGSSFLRLARLQYET